MSDTSPRLWKTAGYLPVGDEYRGDLICLQLMAGMAISKADAEFYDRHTGKMHRWRPHVDVFGEEGVTVQRPEPR